MSYSVAMDELNQSKSIDFTVGATASFSKVITHGEVQAFADLTGDYNPIHLDKDYAALTDFGRPIAHGALLNGMISKLAGTELPGPGSVVLNADFAFKKPAFVGDEVTASIQLVKFRKDKPIYFTDVKIVNQNGETLLEGKAIIYKMLKK